MYQDVEEMHQLQPTHQQLKNLLMMIVLMKTEIQPVENLSKSLMTAVDFTNVPTDIKLDKIVLREQFSTLLWVFAIGHKMYQDVEEMHQLQPTHHLQTMTPNVRMAKGSH